MVWVCSCVSDIIYIDWEAASATTTLEPDAEWLEEYQYPAPHSHAGLRRKHASPEGSKSPDPNSIINVLCSICALNRIHVVVVLSMFISINCVCSGCRLIHSTRWHLTFFFMWRWLSQTTCCAHDRFNLLSFLCPCVCFMASII